MSAVKLHLDEDADSHALLRALRHRGVDTSSTGEQGLTEQTDEQQLEWATARKRALVTYNACDFCRIHADWSRKGRPHGGIIVADQQTVSVGEEVRRLLKLTEARSAEQLASHLEFLSNWR